MSLLVTDDVDDATWVHDWMSHALDEDQGHHVIKNNPLTGKITGKERVMVVG